MGNEKKKNFMEISPGLKAKEAPILGVKGGGFPQKGVFF